MAFTRNMQPKNVRCTLSNAYGDFGLALPSPYGTELTVYVKQHVQQYTNGYGSHLHFGSGEQPVKK